MSRDYNDERPKRSWKEIDRNKDRSKHRTESIRPTSGYKKARADNASKIYKSKLGSFFDGTGKAPEHVKRKIENLQAPDKESKARIDALKKIKMAVTSSEIEKAVDKYMKKWKLPDDFDVLLQVLKCEDEDYLSDAMDIIIKLLKLGRTPPKVRLLEQRLNSLLTLADDPDIIQKADSIIKMPGVF